MLYSNSLQYSFFKFTETLLLGEDWKSTQLKIKFVSISIKTLPNKNETLFNSLFILHWYYENKNNHHKTVRNKKQQTHIKTSKKLNNNSSWSWENSV